MHRAGSCNPSCLSQETPLSCHTRDVHGKLLVPAIMARSLTIQLCGAGSIITNVCSVSTMCARRVKLRMATERLRRLYDRVTGGLHPFLVMLVGVCLCVV